MALCSAYVGDNGMDGAGDTTVRFQTIQQHQVVTIGNSEPEYNGVVLTKQPPSESLYNMAESTIFADGDLHDRSRTIVSEYEVPLNRSNFPIYHDVEVCKGYLCEICIYSHHCKVCTVTTVRSVQSPL